MQPILFKRLALLFCLGTALVFPMTGSFARPKDSDDPRPTDSDSDKATHQTPTPRAEPSPRPSPPPRPSAPPNTQRGDSSRHRPDNPDRFRNPDRSRDKDQHRPGDAGKKDDHKRNDNNGDRHDRRGDRDSRRHWDGPWYSTWDRYGYPDPFWSGSYYWDGYYHYWGGYTYSPYRYGPAMDPSFYDSYSSPAARSDSAPIFFPPLPPPLGTPPPMAVPSAPDAKAPAELADFINDPFYSPLGTRLAQNDLPSEVRVHVESYREAKKKELTELRAKLAALAGAEPSARKKELETFSEQQAPRLAALESEAERIRESLFRKGLPKLIQGSNNWNDMRDWRLDSDTNGIDARQAMLMKFQVVRAASFYQDGITPTLRRLLREAAMDLQIQAFTATEAQDQPASSENLIFFSPETAQLRLPDDLSPSLSAKFATYSDQKRTLRNEFINALATQDGSSAKKRLVAIDELMAKQAPKFAALEVLADDIRSEVIKNPEMFSPAKQLALPADLERRMRSFLEARQKLQTDVTTEFEQLKTLAEPAQLRLTAPDSEKKNGTDASALSVVLTPRLGQSEAKLKAMRERIATFNQTCQPLYDAMQKEQNGILADLAKHLESQPTSLRGMTPAEAMKKCEATLRELAAWDRSKEYFTALFEPGLSLEQRRLLFDGAIATLALPLPPAE